MHLKEDISALESHLESFFDQIITNYSEELYNAAKFSLLGGGKRIRPHLFFAILRAFNLERAHFLPVASSIEMIHTYSLIHDDLPALDNDSLRRGKPTLHIQFSESTALLAGDLLLTLPYSLIAKCQVLTNTQKVALFDTFGRCAGGEGLLGGQILDLSIENSIASLDAVKKVAIGKTGKMLSLPLICGAVVTSCSKEAIEAVDHIGQKLGIVYQMIDDIIDCTQSDAVLGKTARSDLKNNKSTFVQLLGVNETKQMAHDLTNEIKSEISALPFETKELISIVEKLLLRNH